METIRSIDQFNPNRALLSDCVRSYATSKSFSRLSLIPAAPALAALDVAYHSVALGLKAIRATVLFTLKPFQLAYTPKTSASDHLIPLAQALLGGMAYPMAGLFGQQSVINLHHRIYPKAAADAKSRQFYQHMKKAVIALATLTAAALVIRYLNNRRAIPQPPQRTTPIGPKPIQITPQGMYGKDAWEQALLPPTCAAQTVYLPWKALITYVRDISALRQTPNPNSLSQQQLSDLSFLRKFFGTGRTLEGGPNGEVQHLYDAIKHSPCISLDNAPSKGYFKRMAYAQGVHEVRRIARIYTYERGPLLEQIWAQFKNMLFYGHTDGPTFEEVKENCETKRFLCAEDIARCDEINRVDVPRCIINSDGRSKASLEWTTF